MEQSIWRKLPALVEDLLANSQAYNFFQAVKILEDYLQADAKQEHWWQRVRLVPAASLAFPSADIQRCYLDAEQTFVMELNFMGLYGVDSVLPNYFLQPALLDNASGECLRHFLNIFNQAFYRLMYQAWKKSQFTSQDSAWQKFYNHTLNYLITGTQTNRLSSTASARFFAQRIRNQAQLFNLLHNQLPDVPIRIKSSCINWLPIDNQWCLGQSQVKLAVDIVLGNRILDATTQLCIYLGPINMVSAWSLYCNQSDANLLTSLLDNFLSLGSTIKLIYLLQTTGLVEINKQKIYLGINSVIGENMNSYQYQIVVKHC